MCSLVRDEDLPPQVEIPRHEDNPKQQGQGAPGERRVRDRAHRLFGSCLPRVKVAGIRVDRNRADQHDQEREPHVDEDRGQPRHE